MKPLALVLAIGCILAWVGDMSYSDALSEDAHYRLMVCADIWPDYLELKPECPLHKEDKDDE